MQLSLLNYKKNITIFFSFFIIYSIPNIFTDLVGENSPFRLTIQNIEGQMQQQQQQQSQIDYIKYQYQSDFIQEFEIPFINNNETGLKGITTDSKNNVWFYYNTNISSTIIEFNPVNKTLQNIQFPKKQM